MDLNATVKRAEEGSFFLSDLVDARVSTRSDKVGRLYDLMLTAGDASEISHLVVRRPYGDRLFMVPWEDVVEVSPRGAVLSKASPDEAGEMEVGLLLRDHVIDKKAFDLESGTVLVVHDLLLTSRDGRLDVSGVDTTKGGRLRGIVARKPGEELTPWSRIQPIPPNLWRFKGEEGTTRMMAAVSTMRPVDIATLLEGLGPDQRLALFDMLDQALASDILEIIAPGFQRELIMALGDQKVTELVERMTPGQAADALSSLTRVESAPVVDALDPELGEKVRCILGRQEDQAVYYATTRYIRVSPDQTVGEARDGYPRMADGKDLTDYLYVQDDDGRLRGVVDLNSLLRAPEGAVIRDIMTGKVISLRPETTLRDASELFARYEFRAIPVIDEAGAFRGVVPYRDVMKIARNIVE